MLQHNREHFTLLEFKMSISPLWLCVHTWIFHEVNISLGVFKQQTIKDVQQF